MHQEQGGFAPRRKDVDVTQQADGGDILRLQDVTVRYGSFEALSGVSFDLSEGRVGLLGPNGAGKSTLIRTILGFNRAARGAVRVFGLPMPQKALEARRRLGYVPEREAAAHTVSGVSFLTYMGQIAGMSRVDAMERGHEALNFVGIGDQRYRRMETYSTGMLQRFKMAQALIHDPKLLLLDEPSNGLDPEGRMEMLELIRDVARLRNVSVLLSSHLLPDVQHVCERIVILNKGRIVQDGSVDELTAPRERQYEVRTRDHANAGGVPFQETLESAGFTCRAERDGLLRVTLPEGESPQRLFVLASEHGTQIRHFAPARTSLAEAFLQAMGAS